MEKPYNCDSCTKSFYRKGNLVLHLNSHTNGKIPNSEKVRPHSCSLCQKKFTFKRNLLKHLRTIHKDDSQVEQLKVKKIKCPENKCKFICRNVTELRKHINDMHGVRMLKDVLQFSNEKVFLNWKKEEEINSLSWFVTFRQKNKLHGGFTKQILSCHRTGEYKPKGLGKHKLKSHGSCKIGGTCPAAMNVLEHPDGRIIVSYYKTHLGHSHDLKHLHLTREDRSQLREKIECGFSLDAILDDIKQDVKNSPTKRIHVLSRKDLYNIKQSKGMVGKSSNTLPKKENDILSEAQNGLSLSEQSIQINDLQLTAINGEQIKTRSENEFASPFENTSSQTLSVTPHLISYQKIGELTRENNNSLELGTIGALQSTSQVVIVSPVTEFVLVNQTDNNNKINNLTCKIEEKMNKIWNLINKTEYLTPRQYENVSSKLDSIFNIYESVTAKVKMKKIVSRKDRNYAKKS